MPLHSSSGRWRLGLALSLLTVFLWGILPIALMVVLQDLDVYTLTWFRFLVAFGLLAVYLAVRQQLPKLQQLRLPSLGLLAIATIFLGLNYLLFLQGLAQTSPSNAQVLIQLAPVMFGLGAIAVFKERYTLRQWTGMSVLTLGFALFFHEQLRTLITAPSKYLLGSSLLVLAAAMWAVYALAQKQLLQRLPSSSIMLMIYGGCALVFTPVATPQTILSLSPLHLGMLLFCGLNTLVAYGAFAEALDHWEASRVSAVLAATPIFTVLSVWGVSSIMPNLIAPERLTVLGILGAVLVVSGSIAIALGRARQS
ncbi:DMT family transporter [Chroococcidiopsis sp. CCMEE 29]|uniref:DMT family transporter n=1 Tax=Chroococcidiopsis sp. CCMEE 29 TaxID=155894 RepID=UPI002021754F|nr:DMT family transporter [Chroococcidiopsis sp. CCMEE 29]